MESDTLVIGGGPIGAFSAYHLKKSGRNVIWLTGGKENLSAAWASAGLVGVGLSTPLPQYEGLSSNLKWLFKNDSPVKLSFGFMLSNLKWFSQYSRNRQKIVSEDGIKVQTNLSLRSLNILKNLIVNGDLKIDFAQEGILQLFNKRSVVEEHIKQLQRLVGGIVNFEMVDSETCLNMEPLLAKKDVMGIFFPDEGAINPQKFLESIRKLNKSMGVEIVDKKVVMLNRKEKHVESLLTEDGDKLKSHNYLMAAGVNNPVIVKSLGVKIPVIPAWGHSETIIPKDKSLKRPLEIAEEGLFISNVSNVIKLTSFFEFRGLNFIVPNARYLYMEKTASQFFPFMSELKFNERASGMRPCVPDSIPIAGKSSVFDNLFWATGNCRQGVMQSAETARVASLSILGQTIPMEYRLLDPGRFKI